jgi:hypothetical protein
VVGAFEYFDSFIQCRHNCRTGSFSRRTLLVKLVILPFGLRSVSQVSHSVRRCVVVSSGARMIVVLLFIVLEPTEAHSVHVMCLNTQPD